MALIKGENEKVVADDEVKNEKVYVAVNKEWKACKTMLQWVVDNLKDKKVCLVLVHEPAIYTTIFGTKFPINSMAEEEAIVHRERIKQETSNILDDYARICANARVQVEKLFAEMDSIETGLVELISQHKIEKLVMGAAADKCYSKKMKELKSKKAKYVREHAPAFCHISFICKGHLICTREFVTQSQQNDDKSWQEIAEPKLTRFSSESSTSSGRVNFEESLDRSSTFSIPNLSSEATTDSTTDSTETKDREASFWSLSQLFKPKNKDQHHSAKAKSRSTQPNSDVKESFDRSYQSPIFYRSSEAATGSSFEHSEADREALFQLKPEEKQRLLRSPKTMQKNTDDALYSQLEGAIVEATNAKKEALEELLKRRKAEKDVTEAVDKANSAKSMYREELRRRKELEEELAKAKGKRSSQKDKGARHNGPRSEPDRRGSGAAAERSS